MSIRDQLRRLLGQQCYVVIARYQMHVPVTLSSEDGSKFVATRNALGITMVAAAFALEDVESLNTRDSGFMEIILK